MSERQSSLKDYALCPRCAGDRIASGASIDGKEGLRGANRLPVDATTLVALDNYVCLDCGYTEAYIADRGVLNRISRTWRKVPLQK